METVRELFDVVRSRFPQLTEKTDRMHMQRYIDDEFELDFLWFECLADVLNAEMTAQVPYENYASLFEFLDNQVADGKPKIYECVDVAIVENMFFDVKGPHAKPYWDRFPKRLKELYLRFHGRPPL
jgi:hypothetical protein